MAQEITGPERSAVKRLSIAIEGGDKAEIATAERALIEAARASGAADVWEAWAFLSAETATAVGAALKREREQITQRLESLYADPDATWEQILAVARGVEEPDGAQQVA